LLYNYVYIGGTGSGAFAAGRCYLKAVVLSIIIFACIFGGAVLGIFLRAILPERHLTEDSRNMVTIGMGIVATMAAIAVGLMIQGAQISFSGQRSDLIEMSAKIVFLDKLLSDYGPEANGARTALRNTLERTINQFWPKDGSEGAMIEVPESKSETLYYQILSLTPDNDARRAMRDEALSLTYDLAQARDTIVMGQARSIPKAFLIVLGIILFWFVAIFFSFGLYAPTNATVLSTLVISALAVTLALFIIMELNRPFDGLLRMPSEPLVEALQHLGK
jgi:type VI protein secretion system component VasK